MASERRLERERAAGSALFEVHSISVRTQFEEMKSDMFSAESAPTAKSCELMQHSQQQESSLLPNDEAYTLAQSVDRV